MEPISSLVAGHVADKILDTVAVRFRHLVIERWSRRRAEEFFATFCSQCAAERGLINDAEVELSLERLLTDERSSEVLFDAYRRVSLARSRVLGPRVIGLLTAKLMASSRGATEEEENIFQAAESLVDDDFRAFRRFLMEERSRIGHAGSTENENGLRVRLFDDEIDSNWRRRDARRIGPADLDEYFGASWARKLVGLGILTQTMEEREYDYAPDSRSGADEPGTVREVSWWLFVPRAYYELAELTQRADWPDDK